MMKLALLTRGTVKYCLEFASSQVKLTIFIEFLLYTNEYRPSLLIQTSSLIGAESPVSILASADAAGDTSADDDSESFRD